MSLSLCLSLSLSPSSSLSLTPASVGHSVSLPPPPPPIPPSSSLSPSVVHSPPYSSDHRPLSATFSPSLPSLSFCLFASLFNLPPFFLPPPTPPPPLLRWPSQERCISPSLTLPPPPPLFLSHPSPFTLSSSLALHPSLSLSLSPSPLVLPLCLSPSIFLPFCILLSLCLSLLRSLSLSPSLPPPSLSHFFTISLSLYPPLCVPLLLPLCSSRPLAWPAGAGMGLRRGARQQDEQRGDAQRAAAGHGVHQAEAPLETRVQPAVHLSRALRHLPPRLLRLTVAGRLIITEIIIALRPCCLSLNGPMLVIRIHFQTDLLPVPLFCVCCFCCCC